MLSRKGEDVREVFFGHIFWCTHTLTANHASGTTLLIRKDTGIWMTDPQLYADGRLALVDYHREPADKARLCLRTKQPDGVQGFLPWAAFSPFHSGGTHG